jgi:alkanesulfonate monooxygenase SsuD/methylene tetrahydromethanopterin reductase-like flavin-dependent oxidoreductase (luciferase family)
MRFSVWPSFQRPWSETVAVARRAEEQGWYGIWCADHYMPDSADGAPQDGPGLECWTSIAALTGLVQRLQLGSLVSPSTMHHPAILAKQATTVDAASDGRVVVGVGAGWQVNEHRAYGVELPAPRERVDRFEEFVQILRGLLHEPRTTFEGTYFSVVAAPCEPKGGPGPVPILIGTSSPRMLRLTARYADVWNTWGTPEHIRDCSAALDRACEAEGRDPATLRRTAQALFFINDDPDTVGKILDRAPSDRTLAGSTSALADRVAEYAAIGVDEVIVPDFTLGRTADERAESYDRFWREVAGALV